VTIESDGISDEGGGVMGVSGHNAAKRVLSDQRRARVRWKNEGGGT